ncbi:MAG: DUF4214 domain-containing protein [Clostridiales bacterium]|nr:DUF4214 domain-containing protein [Clostridiales bacterium]
MRAVKRMTHKFYEICAVLLCVGLLLTLLPGILFTKAEASTADSQEATLLGTLSEGYESNGNPGTISSGVGDSGGASYGAFQFSSRYNVPKLFFNWCIAQTGTNGYVDIGTQLKNAYTTDKETYGTQFNSVWKALAASNSYGGSRGIFWQAQRDYVRLSYYDPIVSAIESSVPGFSMSNYSIALRNVFWSRAVQHGTGGAKGVIMAAFSSLGGFSNQDEATLIEAIYQESGAVVSPVGNVMQGETANKFGISGCSLAYYYGNSSGVQVGVFQRLQINELSDAQQMLATYGSSGAPVSQGIYTLTQGGQSRQFQLRYYANGCYTLTGVSGGEAGLRLTGGSDGGVCLTATTSSNEQFWRLIASNGGYRIQNLSNNLYLTPSGSTLFGSSTASQWSVTGSGSDWSLMGACFPTASNYLPHGYGYPIRGTLSSTFPISSVNITISNNSTGNTVISKNASVNAQSYDLRNLDNSIAFGSLPVGTYTFTLNAVNSAESWTMKTVFYVVPDGEDEPKNYVLTFNALGGSCNTVYRTVTPGSAYGSLPSASLANYTFDGWFTAPVGGTPVASSTTASSSRNQMVYAHYTLDGQLNLKAFVQRLYQICLGQQPTDDGVATWMGRMTRGELTAAQVAAEFFGSRDSRSNLSTNDQFITALYQVLLGREPDANGFADWTGKLKAETWTRPEILNGFCNSSEFAELCASYGVTPGQINPGNYDMGRDVSRYQTFITRLYNECLNREPDADGMTNWTNHLVRRDMNAAEVAGGFFSSSEYLTKVQPSDSDFVTDLYRALLGRDPDADGYADWTGKLLKGTWLRAEVFNGFCNSSEFRSICSEFGISTGQVDIEAYDMGRDLTRIHAFLSQVYTKCLNREPDAEGLVFWTNHLASRDMSGAEVVAGFFSSSEYRTKISTTDDQFVTALYWTMLGREPDADGFADWTGKLRSGSWTRPEVLDGFCNSDEFRSVCARFGIIPGRITPSDYWMGMG